MDKTFLLAERLRLRLPCRPLMPCLSELIWAGRIAHNVCGMRSNGRPLFFQIIPHGLCLPPSFPYPIFFAATESEWTVSLSSSL